jgi:hypothetical protein
MNATSNVETAKATIVFKKQAYASTDVMMGFILQLVLCLANTMAV